MVKQKQCTFLMLNYSNKLHLEVNMDHRKTAALVFEKRNLCIESDKDNYYHAFYDKCAVIVESIKDSNARFELVSIETSSTGTLEVSVRSNSKNVANEQSKA